MLMVELPGGNWWTRDVAQRLVGRHLTKPYSEQWMDEAMQESAAGGILSICPWETYWVRNGVDLSIRNIGIVRRKNRSQKFRRNSAGMSWSDTTLPRGE